MPTDDAVRLDRSILPLRPKKRWSPPTVIKSEIEKTDKLADLVDITLLPTGPS